MTEKKLFPFQEEIVKEIEKRKKLIVRASPGLGKTVIACEFIRRNPDKTVLILTPPITPLVKSWIEHLFEWAKLKPNELQVITKGGTLIDYYKRVILVPYTIFTKLYLMMDRRDILILDENHLLKDPKRKRSRAVLQYSHFHRPEFIIMLTGTPIYNKPIDLWTSLHLCNPVRFNSFWKFAIQYCGAYKNKWGYWEFPAHASQRLRSLVKPYIVSKTWQEVKDQIPVPPLIKKEIPLGKATKEIVELNKLIERTEEGLKKENLKKRQRQLVGIQKIPKVVELLTDYLIHKHDRIVLFVWHRKVAETYREKLNGKGIKAEIFYGGLSGSEKMKLLDEFKKGEIQILIMNWLAGGLGLNMEFCHCGIFAELDYTTSAIQQAFYRIFRLTSKEPVFVYFTRLEDSYEDRIVEILLEKEDVQEKILGKLDFKLPFEERESKSFGIKLNQAK